MTTKEKLALFICATDFAVASLKEILNQEKINYASAETYVSSLSELTNKIKVEYLNLRNSNSR